MKNLGLVCTLLSLCCISAVAQEAPRPFATVDAGLAQRLYDRSAVSAAFQAERTRLGGAFEAELWKYLAKDADKTDKYETVSRFLVYPDYLHGSAPMPFLALQLEDKAISLLRGKTDIEGRGTSLTINVSAAGLSAELELPDQAEAHKRNAERLAAKDFFLLLGFFPARTAYEICVYDAIGDDEIKGSPASACADKKKAEEKDQPAMIQIGQIPGAKIIARPAPLWPAPRSGAGAVTVEVVIDETGKVESAHATAGPASLRAAAENAARLARFRKTRYLGRDVKVSGLLDYKL